MVMTPTASPSGGAGVGGAVSGSTRARAWVTSSRPSASGTPVDEASERVSSSWLRAVSRLVPHSW